MELLQYFRIINRRKWVVILTTVLTVVIVGFGSLLMTPVYTAYSLVRIAQIQDRNVSFYDLNYTARLMNTYTYLLSSGPFLDEVFQRLDLDISINELAESIYVGVIPNTELIEISAETKDPVQAMQIANTISELLVEQREDLYTGQGRSSREILEEQLTIIQSNLAEDREEMQRYILQGTTLEHDAVIQDLSIQIQVQEQTYAMLLEQYDTAIITEAAFANSLSIVQPAGIPTTPSKPNKLVNILLGGMVGVVGGIALAFLFESLDLTIHSADELEGAVELPMLGEVPQFDSRTRSELRATLVMDKGQSAEREAFRILRTNIQSLLSTNGSKVLLVTSPKRGTGKSTILVNLAMAMAHTDQKVIVVDSNLRAPCLHETFSLHNDLGLSTIVSDPDQLDPATWIEHTKFPRISLLSSGPLPSNPTERLGSQHMLKILNELTQHADLIMLDSPATLNYADAATLAPMVDGVVLVAAQGETTDGDLEKTLQQMDKVKAKILGVVFNKSTMGKN